MELDEKAAKKTNIWPQEAQSFLTWKKNGDGQKNKTSKKNEIFLRSVCTWGEQTNSAPTRLEKVLYIHTGIS